MKNSKLIEGPIRPKASPARLDEQLCFALYTASSLMTRLYRPLLEPLGLTYPQYLAMLVLWEKSPRGVGELAEALGWDFGTISPLLKRLEASGHILRSRYPQDERRVQVDLTREGSHMRRRAARIPEALACRLDVSREDALALRSLVKTFNRALKQSNVEES